MRERIKIPLALVMVLVLIPLSLTLLRAIPNQIGGFIATAGIPFENYSEKEDTWKPGAELPGKWEVRANSGDQDQGSGVEAYRLSLTANVFGIRASQVTALVKDDRILQFNVVFDKKPGRSASLVNQLKTNIRSFTGEKGDTEKGIFAHKNIDIQIKDGSNGSVVVTFSPNATAVAAQ